MDMIALVNANNPRYIFINSARVFAVSGNGAWCVPRVAEWLRPRWREAGPGVCPAAGDLAGVEASLSSG